MRPAQRLCARLVERKPLWGCPLPAPTAVSTTVLARAGTATSGLAAVTRRVELDQSAGFAARRDEHDVARGEDRMRQSELVSGELAVLGAEHGFIAAGGTYRDGPGPKSDTTSGKQRRSGSRPLCVQNGSPRPGAAEQRALAPVAPETARSAAFEAGNR